MAKSIRRKQPKDKQQHKKPPHSWAAVKSLFTCKYLQVQPPQPHVQPSQQRKPEPEPEPEPKTQTKPIIKKKHPAATTKIKCSGSICNNTKVMQKPDPGPKPFPGSRPEPHSPSVSGPFRGMPFRKLSGCYECRFVVDPVLGMSKDPSLRGSICSCPECGEIFMKAENLELHQAVRHAVSELGPEDTSKNIVEIIFQSSWLKKQAPICKIDRILKVQNTPTTISKFEEYRDAIKAKATRQPKKHPRCLADGNELLRFHCTTLMCSLGLNGSSNLCGPSPTCGVCSVIKNGFKVTSDVSSIGILTTATSGKAHDSCRVGSDNDHGKRAMLVCRVIAGRVKKNPDGNSEDYDSVSGSTGVYSNLEELYVMNPKAILPCFVVIYRGF
ncbi:C2H2-like zinc finger protein [Striga hermonthica]|uniref:C2H2-like zinc finger protein n=1 Tax=Striga hermonthica TaxID=68872 RepID=A0A9N7NCG0_STRHE|nr:C2H2-like zinc finger protein [Striga hermonthica]